MLDKREKNAKIETWQLLEHKFGELNLESFDQFSFQSFLDDEMNRGRVLYSNAYMIKTFFIKVTPYNLTLRQQVPV